MKIKPQIITYIFISFIFCIQDIKSQILEENDTIQIEDKRNYLGANISPLMSGIVMSKSDYDIKLSLAYKRNYGDKNLRFSLNHLTEGNVMYYDTYYPINTTDTSITNRYFNYTYTHNDFRIGFEELRGYYGTRVHIGVDAIFGYGTNNSNYFERTLIKDSLGMYNDILDFSSNYEGSHTIDYLITGIDVSFGIDWVLNEQFIFTFQVTPQFNYYIFIKEKIRDKYNSYISADDYADFNLGYIDLMLYYRF
jgi:hypothetical protein